MAWTKQGLVFEPPVDVPWMKSHAAVPFGHLENEGILRLYFNSRDDRNRARVGRLILDIETQRVVSLDREPVLDLGPLGAFDDHGVVGSWIVEREGKQYLYYSGMTLGVTVPFYFYLGVAVSEDGGFTFQRYSPAPILERNEIDPYLTGQVCVRIEGGLWRMWYVSGVRWEPLGPQGAKHFYHIKYAESDDGLHWRRDGRTCIDFESDEYAIARPCVLADGETYRMWFCYRGDDYRIGYAESDDGLCWRRLDHLGGLEPSRDGWDAEMTAYPFVYDHGANRRMLYCGNGYGRTGIGAAIWHERNGV